MIELHHITDTPRIFGMQQRLLEDVDLWLPRGRYALLSRKPEFHRAIVDVSYKNFDHPSVLTISLVRNPEGWKVDDVASLGADDHWLLSWLLTYDPTGVH